MCVFPETGKHVWRKEADSVVEWGTVFKGIDEGDGWVRVGTRYLPIKISNFNVLTPATDIWGQAPQDRQRNEDTRWASDCVRVEVEDVWGNTKYESTGTVAPGDRIKSMAVVYGNLKMDRDQSGLTPEEAYEEVWRAKRSMVEVEQAVYMTGRDENHEAHGKSQYTRRVGDGVQTRLLLDSGATSSVCPEAFCDHLPVQETHGSVRGHKFYVANGDTMKDLGLRKVRGLDSAGSRMNIHFVVCEGLERPLLSVAQLSDMGNLITLDKTRGWITNPGTGSKTKVMRRGGHYLVELWVHHPEEAPFHRLGNP